MNLGLLIPPTASPRPQSRGMGAGSRSQMQSQQDSQAQNKFKDRFSNINNAKSQIERQREFDAQKQRLKVEFDKLDLNKDGLVTLDELQEFLQSKSKDGQFDPNITEDIYNMIDQNRDGRITIDEFVSKYLDTRQKLNERLKEVYRKISDHKRQRDEMQNKLDQVRKIERPNEYGIMHGSILTVHVVEARDLKALNMDGTSDPYVTLEIEDQKIETGHKKGSLSPVWNESFTFDIYQGRDVLTIMIYNKNSFGRDELLGVTQVTLDQLRSQMKEDLWLELQDEQGREEQGRIRLMVQWVYSKVQYFSEYLSKWDDTLVQDVHEKEQIENLLKQIQNPFGFLEQIHMEVIQDEEESIDDANQAEQKSKYEVMFRQNEKKLQEQERYYVQNVEIITQNIAQKFGFSYVPWFTLTKIVLGIYTTLTCFVLFFRPDFINLTVCTAAIYMITNTDSIKKWTFRALVLGILLSLLFDLFWFLSQDYSSQTEDGGVEKSVRTFSLNMSYFSFFFRIIVALVFWKDSLDFQRIIRQQNDQIQTIQSPERSRSEQHKKVAEQVAMSVKDRKIQMYQAN